MTITIRIKTDNEAFTDDKQGEVNAIVQDTARRIANGERDGKVRDGNGNTVGWFKVAG